MPPPLLTRSSTRRSLRMADATVMQVLASGGGGGGQLLLLTTASEDALRDTNNLFPSTIQGVVQRRVDQLTAAQQFVLRIAAVIGRVFEPQLLIDIMPLKQGIDARRQLAELCALGYFERATER